MVRSPVYERLREAIGQLPVIDCHEHAKGPAGAPEGKDPLLALIPGYVRGDLDAAIEPSGPTTTERFWQAMQDPRIGTEEKWALFEPVWRHTEHTAYAQVTKRVLRDVYGEPQLSLAALQRIAPRLLDLQDPRVYAGVLDKAGIRCRLCDRYDLDLARFLAGKEPIYERDRLLIPLPRFHEVRSWQAVAAVASIVHTYVVSLDDFLAACQAVFRRLGQTGAVGMKDQLAYHRTLDYDNPSRAEAERLFNRIMSDPRQVLGWPEAKALDDWLFHRFMEIAGEMGLPVQIHTGHLGVPRDEITRANAVLLTPLLELHREVRFDLFHGNWPYLGEMLYLAKNYPNVRIDICWAHIIDPLYSRQLLSEGLVTVPHTKFHGFGGDYLDEALHAAAHLEMARDVIAEALAERVESGWLSEVEALQVAADWLFNNANEYFRLGYETVRI